MKTLQTTRAQIFRGIQAALFAFFLVGTGRPALAEPTYTPPYYTLNGTLVTGSGTSSAAYFDDASMAFYTVNIRPGSNLGDGVTSEVGIGEGTVNNAGTLTYTGSNLYQSGVTIGTSGTVNNSGTITAPQGYAVQYFGTTGTLNNSTTGKITSDAGTYFFENGTVSNEGFIIATSTSFSIPVEIDGVGQVTNSGTMTGSSYGVQLSGNSVTGRPLYSRDQSSDQ